MRCEPNQFNIETEEPFRKIFEEGPLGMAIVGLDYRFVKVNATLCHMLGYTEEELRKRSFVDITHPDDIDMEVQLAQRVFKGEIPFYELEKRYIKKDGAVLWIHLNASVICDEEGKPLYGIAMIEDISERKQKEEQLRFQAQLLDSVRESVVATDLQGRVVYWGKGAEALYGYTAEEVMGKPITFIVGSQEVTEEEARMRQVREKGSWSGQYWQRRKDGTKFWADTFISLATDQNGQPFGLIGIDRDITDRKRAEEALAHSEEKFRSLFENASDTIIVTDKNARITMANSKVKKLFGYEPEELKGKLVDILLPQRFRDICAKHRARYLSKPKIRLMGAGIDLFALRKDGSEFPVEIALNFVRSKNESLLMWNITDITQRKLAEQALRESEEKYRTLFEESNDPIYITERSGKIIDVNRAFLNFFGYTKEELKKINARKLYANPADRKTFMEVIEKNGFVKNFELKLLTKSGQEKICSLTSTIRQDRDGNISGYQGIIRDITERKKTEVALRESEEKYRMVVQNSNEAIIIVQDEIIKFANSKINDITGYSIEELASKPFMDLIYSEDLHIVLKHIGIRSSREEFTNVDSFRIICKQGNIKWVEISSAFVRWEGKPANLCFLNDITDRRYLQEQLARAQRLETAGRVAGQIAHDFNNLLSPLAAYPTLIREELPPNHPVLNMLEEMEECANRIAQINQQLLALGRRWHYSLEPIDLNELIHNVLVSQILSGEVVIREELAANLFLIKGGAAQLIRAFTNLINNAVEAMQGTGVLTVRTANMYLDQPLRGYRTIDPGEYVKLEVSDTGTGIPRDILDKIFDPFFTTKKMDRRRGSGLGLSVVHGIVEDHKGYITVDTELGRGTTFSLYFPVTREVRREIADAVKKSKGGGERILVVDDDPMQRKVCAHLLKRLGYKVHSVSSGEKAIKRAKEHFYDLIILDMVMDGIDGTEAYRQILDYQPEQKAIILSGYAMTQRVEEAIRLGAGSFVSKPVTLDILAAVVRKELDEK